MRPVAPMVPLRRHLPKAATAAPRQRRLPSSVSRDLRSQELASATTMRAPRQCAESHASRLARSARPPLRRAAGVAARRARATGGPVHARATPLRSASRGVYRGSASGGGPAVVDDGMGRRQDRALPGLALARRRSERTGGSPASRAGVDAWSGGPWGLRSTGTLTVGPHEVGPKPRVSARGASNTAGVSRLSKRRGRPASAGQPKGRSGRRTVAAPSHAPRMFHVKRRSHPPRLAGGVRTAG